MHASSSDLSGGSAASGFNVRDFGALGDGRTPDSEAIQKALDAAGAVGGTPQVGFRIRKLNCTVIASNTLYRGYTDEMVSDLGEHGTDYVFANNVGCATQ